jgi:hypothetical protein
VSGEVPARFEYFARLSLLVRPREERGTVITMPVNLESRSFFEVL